MAITTIADANISLIPTVSIVKPSATAVGVYSAGTLWARAGMPAAGSYNATLNGVTLTAPVTGQIPLTDAASGETYVHRMVAATSLASSFGSALLCDRLWHNGGISATSTSPQAITSPTWPARDINGSSNGEGVLLALEISSITGAGNPTITISYTNSAGTPGRTSTNIIATVASTGAGACYLMSLDSGDLGVRSVQSITLSATWTTGTLNIVAYRPIALSAMRFASFHGEPIDCITGGFQKVPAGAVPYLLYLPWNQNVTTILSQIQFAQG